MSMNSGYALLVVDTRTPNPAFLVDRAAVLFAEKLKNACQGISLLGDTIGTNDSRAIDRVPFPTLVVSALSRRFGESTNLYTLLHEYHRYMKHWLHRRAGCYDSRGRVVHERIIRELYCIPGSDFEHLSMSDAIYHARMEKITIVDGFPFDGETARLADDAMYEACADLRTLTPKATPAP
jgi:hypothetical protein